MTSAEIWERVTTLLFMAAIQIQTELVLATVHSFHSNSILFCVEYTNPVKGHFKHTITGRPALCLPII